MNKKSMLIGRILAICFLVSSILVGLSVNDQGKSNLSSYFRVPEITITKSLTNTPLKTQLNKEKPNIFSSKSEPLQNLLNQILNKKKSKTVTPLNSQAQSKEQKISFWIPLLIFLSLLLAYVIVLWRKPTLLLEWTAEIPIPKVGTFPGMKIPILPKVLKYLPRVLDAWVDERIQQARLEFERRPTVNRRSVHISLPIQLDEEKIDRLELNNKTLQQIFAKQEVKLLIFGEGGIGKTSWACQLAKWAMAEDSNQRLCQHLMIPIMIEDELEAVDSISALSIAILRQLKNLSDDEKPASEELLNQLLKKRRLLIIVDHISEMSEASRKALASRLKDPNALINALVITSRVENIFGSEVTYSLLRPQRVASEKLLEFMGNYLRQLNKRNLFPDDEYIDDFKRLSLIVSGKRDITVLFAKLYLEQMVAKVEGRLSDKMPENVPELMLSYLNELNYNLAEKELSSEIIHRTAKITAWECLQTTFKPETAERKTILETLAASESGDTKIDTVEKNLLYLEKRLQIIRRVQPSLTKVRFELDPLAEYLASLFLIENYKDNVSEWENLLSRLETIKDAGEEINGFSFALYDSCISKSTEYGIPSSIINRLSELSGVDIEEIEYKQIIQRIQRLTENLSHASYGSDEIRYIDEALKKIVSISRSINPIRQKTIVRALINLANTDNSISRAKIIELLGKSSYISEQVLSVLKNSLKDPDPYVRSNAVHACASLRLSTDNISTLLDDFLNCLNDENQMVRTNTASAIGHLDLTSTEIEVAVQALLEFCNNSENSESYSFAISSLGSIGPLCEDPDLILNTILDHIQEIEKFDRNHPSSFGKGQCAHALGNFRPQSFLKDRTFQVLKSFLKDQDDMVRSDAVRSMSKLCSIIGGESIKEICNQLEYENNEYARLEMIKALSGLISLDNINSNYEIKKALEIAFCVSIIKYDRYSQELPYVMESLKKVGYTNNNFENIISVSFSNVSIQRRAKLNLKNILEQLSYHC